MAFRSSKQSRIYIGILAAAAYARNAATASTTDMIDITTLADTSKAFIPGQPTSTFSIDGPLDADATANGQYDAITTQKGATTPTPITYLPYGTDGGAQLIEADHTQLDTLSSGDGSSDWSLASQTTGKTDVNGVLLENNTTVTVDTDGTAVDLLSAGNIAGGVLHLHVTAYSGLTSDAIIVEHSTTGSFGGEETTLASFASVTGLTSERIETATVVKRHLRVVDDVTGTGSITRFIAVSRR